MGHTARRDDHQTPGPTLARLTKPTLSQLPLRIRPVHRRPLDAVWPDPIQRDRALGTLVADGLIDPLPDGRYALPGHT